MFVAAGIDPRPQHAPHGPSPYPRRTVAARSFARMDDPQSGSRAIASTALALLLATASAIVVALSIAVLRDPGPLPGDLWIVRHLQRIGEPVPTFADWVRLTTSTEATLVVFAIPAWLVIRRHRRAGALAVAIAVATMLIAQPAFKELIDRPRPSTEQVDVRAGYDSASFPSGHSMSTATAWGAAAMVAARHRRRREATALCVPIALTSVASLIQGVHWPSDSLAGLLIGGIAACGAATVLRRAERGTQ